MASARSLAELLEHSRRCADQSDDTTSSEDGSPTRSRSASPTPSDSELTVFDRPVTRRTAAQNQVKLFPVLWTNSTSSVEKFFEAANDAAETIGMPLELDSSSREDDDDDGGDEDDTCEDLPPTRKPSQSSTPTRLKSPSISEPRSGRKRKRPQRRYTKPYRSRPAKQPHREAVLGTSVVKGHGSPPSTCHGRPMYELLETGHGPLIPKHLSTRRSVSTEALASHLVSITEQVLLNLDRSYHIFKSEELKMMECGYRLLCDYFRPPFDIYQVIQVPILFLLPENINDAICYQCVLLFLLYMKLKNGGRLKGVLNHPYVE